MANSVPILTAANAALPKLKQQYLADVETVLLQRAIENQANGDIVDSSGYSINYLKRDIGPKL